AQFSIGDDQTQPNHEPTQHSQRLQVSNVLKQPNGESQITFG
ncbi:21112_t:CDS:2, partial [Cetraspora pellucida]